MTNNKEFNNSLTNDSGGVTFNCPNCSKEVIRRTGNDRQIVAKYTCSACGFEGPN